jgi:hypothetical protein
VEGMSSDESDFVVEGNRIYRVLKPAWRAAAVGNWFHVLDRLYLLFRRETGGALARGSFPRRRLRADTRISRSMKFVPGLPASAYDPQWFANRLETRHTVRPASKPYAFEHSAEIMQ